MGRDVDLRVHTTFSDGALSPSEVVDAAYRVGLAAVAITDHDSIDGVDEALTAAQRLAGIEAVPGIEISTYLATTELHILGYFVRPKEPSLVAALQRACRLRRERAHAIIDTLRDLGIDVSWDDVLELAGGPTIGRAHIAQALVRQGQVGTIEQAFALYLSKGAVAYVPRHKATPCEAMELIHNAGGASVLAHPWGLTQTIPDIASLGIQGIEVHYPGYGPEMVAHLGRLASDYGLVPCGGSDYHGIDAGVEAAIGDVRVPWESLTALRARVQQGAAPNGAPRS